MYGDAIGKRASYESIVQITDFEASKQMQVVTQNAQWFEDNSPLIESHKKKDVKGVSYKVVQVASESGDTCTWAQRCDAACPAYHHQQHDGHIAQACTGRRSRPED